jgi:protein arginine N-methyltransferase 1
MGDHLLNPVELFPEIQNLYDFPSVHADMLFDTTRVSAYRSAIQDVVKTGDVVADLGSGTGLLTFLCLQAGAARVHAIERSNVITWAQELTERNGLSDKVTFHNCDAREARLDERVDVIVSELMGHLAFEEGMAETICAAKERILKHEGISIPQSVTLRASLVCQQDLYRNCIDIWGDVEGFDFSFVRQKALGCAYVTEIASKDLLSDPQTLLRWDFNKGAEDVDRKLCFQTWRDGEVNGLALWFDASLTPSIRLSSGPWSNTHWQQCFVPFAQPLRLSAGALVRVAVTLTFQRRKNIPFRFSVAVL